MTQLNFISTKKSLFVMINSFPLLSNVRGVSNLHTYDREWIPRPPGLKRGFLGASPKVTWLLLYFDCKPRICMYIYVVRVGRLIKVIHVSRRDRANC